MSFSITKMVVFGSTGSMRREKLNVDCLEPQCCKKKKIRYNPRKINLTQPDFVFFEPFGVI